MADYPTTPLGPEEVAPAAPSPEPTPVPIPDVFYSLADELAEVQGELRRASGPRHPHHHHGPHHDPHHGPHGPRPLPPHGPEGPLVAPGTHEPFPAPHFAHGPAVPPPPPLHERDPRAPHPMERVGRGTHAVLRYLSEHDGEASPSAIASDLRLSNARISNILAALEKQGFITREHEETDRRKVVVKLTEAGTAHASEMAHGVRGELASFLYDLGEDDSRELIALLQRVLIVVRERRDRAIDEEVERLASVPSELEDC